MKEIHRSKASFRDPDGYVFTNEKDELLRVVHNSYSEVWSELNTCGLFGELHSKKLLVFHEEINELTVDHDKLIKPKKIPFISYPYEWSFNQLKDAALLTLKIQKLSLKKNFSLKDATPYNVQFLDGKPIFIDTLSFEKLNQENPWTAYHQFCTMFYAPLVLQAFGFSDAQGLLKIHLDGIPLNDVSRMLPFKSRFNPSVYMHIHLHAKFSQKHEGRKAESSKLTYSKRKHEQLIDNLIRSISKLRLPSKNSTWNKYYETGLLSENYFEKKKEAVKMLLNKIEYSTVWDLGCNEGEFSKLTKETSAVIATDLDYKAIDQFYLKLKETKSERILPLVFNISNPSAGIGWKNEERTSFLERINVDLTLALAVMHHLRISNNVPFALMAEMFAKQTQYLIFEYVPKDDPNVERIMGLKKDVYLDYTRDHFLLEFKKWFRTIESLAVQGSKRELYLFERK